jgi:hypothetical protein
MRALMRNRDHLCGPDSYVSNVDDQPFPVLHSFIHLFILLNTHWVATDRKNIYIVYYRVGQ